VALALVASAVATPAASLAADGDDLTAARETPQLVPPSPMDAW
jgi:hypothetical protein